MTSLKTAYLIAFISLAAVSTTSASYNFNVEYEDGNIVEAAKCIEKIKIIVYNSQPKVVSVASSPDLESKTLLSQTLKVFSQSYRTQFYVEPYSCAQYVIGKTSPDFIIYANNVTDFNKILGTCEDGFLPSQGNPPLVVFSIGYQLIKQEITMFSDVYIKELFLVVISNSSNVTLYYLRKGVFTDLELDCDKDAYSQMVNAMTVVYKLNLNITVGYRILPPFTIKIPTIGRTRIRRKQASVTGIEVELLKEMGFNITFFVDRHGWSKRKNKFNDLLKDLLNDKIDIIIGGFSIYQQNNIATYSYPFIYSDLIAVVRSDDVDPDYVNTKIIFFRTSLIIMFCVIFIYTVLLVYIQASVSLTEICISFFGLSLGIPIKLIKYKGRFTKLLLMALIWISFAMTAAYNSKMKMFLMNKATTPAVDQLRRLCTDNYTIFVNYDVNYSIALSRQCKIPIENLLWCDNVFHCLDEAPKHNSKKYAAITLQKTFDAVYFQYLNPDFSNKFHAINKAIRKDMICFMVRRRTALISFISIVGDILYKAAITKKHLKGLEHHIQTSLENAKLNMGRTKQAERVSMDQLSTCFNMYVCMVALSTFVLLCELLWFRYGANIIGFIVNYFKE